MVTQVIQTEERFVRSRARSLNVVERHMLRRFHPHGMLLNSLATMWSIYFMWHHQWREAIGAVLAAVIVGALSTKKLDYASLAGTTWGKLAFLHLEPINIAVQSVGVIALFYGVWAHSAPWILGAITVIVLGHWFGWERVHESL